MAFLLDRKIYYNPATMAYQEKMDYQILSNRRILGAFLRAGFMNLN